MTNQFTKQMAQSAAITALATMINTMDLNKELWILTAEDRKKLIDKIADDLLESMNQVFGNTQNDQDDGPVWRGFPPDEVDPASYGQS